MSSHNTSNHHKSKAIAKVLFELLQDKEAAHKKEVELKDKDLETQKFFLESVERGNRLKKQEIEVLQAKVDRLLGVLELENRGGSVSQRPMRLHDLLAGRIFS